MMLDQGKKHHIPIFISLFAVILAAMFLPLYSHVPVIPGKFDSLGRAHMIESVEKSWAVYNDLKTPEDLRFYRFRLNEGQTVKFKLFVPPGQKNLPVMYLLDPDGKEIDCPPDHMAVPPHYGVRLIESGGIIGPEYEPFTPSWFNTILNYEIKARKPGIYYLVFSSPSGPTQFGFGIGEAESFTFTEWVKVPLDVVGIHLWEGQSFFLVMAPLLLICALGFAPLISMNGEKWFTSRWQQKGTGWPLYLAALTFLGGSAMILMQVLIALAEMGYDPAMWISIIIALLPVPIGLYLLFDSIRPESGALTACTPPMAGKNRFLNPLRRRIVLVVFAILGLILWAGFYIGPLLLLVEALRPGRKVES